LYNNFSYCLLTKSLGDRALRLKRFAIVKRFRFNRSPENMEEITDRISLFIVSRRHFVLRLLLASKG
jgi:hypothetical protein